MIKVLTIPAEVRQLISEWAAFEQNFFSTEKKAVLMPDNTSTAKTGGTNGAITQQPT